VGSSRRGDHADGRVPVFPGGNRARATSRGRGRKTRSPSWHRHPMANPAIHAVDAQRRWPDPAGPGLGGRNRPTGRIGTWL